jgi:hypothetical protein
MIPSPIQYDVQLTRFPETSGEYVDGIQVRVSRREDTLFTFAYILKGDLARIRLPPHAVARPADRLWEHTCFEAFVQLKGQAVYYEFNFSPSGEWAVYSFRDYRDGGPMENDELDPKIAVRRESETLELSAVMRLDLLPVIQPGAVLRLGLSAVIEDDARRLSYWALKHPPGKPDFHHPDNFILEIQLPIVDGTNAIAYTGKP